MDLLLGCSDVTVICEENGVRRPCTTHDVTKAGLCQQSEFPLSIYLFTPRRVSFSSVSFFAPSIIYTKWLEGMGEMNEEHSKWVSEGLIEWWNELLTFHAFIWSIDWLIDRYWWIAYLVVWSFDWLLAWFTAAILFWFIAHLVSCSQLVLHSFPLHAQTGEVITWKQSD